MPRNRSSSRSATVPASHSSRIVTRIAVKPGRIQTRRTFVSFTAQSSLGQFPARSGLAPVLDLGVGDLLARPDPLGRRRGARAEHPHLLLERQQLLVGARRAGRLLEPLEIVREAVARE